MCKEIFPDLLSPYLHTASNPRLGCGKGWKASKVPANIYLCARVDIGLTVKSSFGAELKRQEIKKKESKQCGVANWASVSEPHTSELNRDFSSNIIIIIIICCTSRIFLTL